MVRHLGMSRSTWNHYVQSGVFERTPEGQWDSRALIEVLESIEEAAMASSAAGPSPALERWREAKAKMAELELEEKRGNLLTLESVTDALNTSNAVLCARLNTYARRAALAVGQPASENQLDDLLRADLEQCRLELRGIKLRNPGE
jgi:hypothetical protein